MVLANCTKKFSILAPPPLFASLAPLNLINHKYAQA